MNESDYGVCAICGQAFDLNGALIQAGDALANAARQLPENAYSQLGYVLAAWRAAHKEAGDGR